ncbi:hypothetical protein V8F20_004810 [Naviculisporaceae sp. PSN 640]
MKCRHGPTASIPGMIGVLTAENEYVTDVAVGGDVMNYGRLRESRYQYNAVSGLAYSSWWYYGVDRHASGCRCAMSSDVGCVRGPNASNAGEEKTAPSMLYRLLGSCSYDSKAPSFSAIRRGVALEDECCCPTRDAEREERPGYNKNARNGRGSVRRWNQATVDPLPALWGADGSVTQAQLSKGDKDWGRYISVNPPPQTLSNSSTAQSETWQ